MPTPYARVCVGFNPSPRGSEPPGPYAGNLHIRNLTYEEFWGSKKGLVNGHAPTSGRRPASSLFEPHFAAPSRPQTPHDGYLNEARRAHIQNDCPGTHLIAGAKGLHGLSNINLRHVPTLIPHISNLNILILSLRHISVLNTYLSLSLSLSLSVSLYVHTYRWIYFSIDVSSLSPSRRSTLTLRSTT